MNDATGRNTARRRRADTIARCGRIMETARRLPLTRDVLAEAIERATPVQPDLMESRLDAEIASRERSKRVRLLKAAGFPNAKDIEGYDWSNLRMPADWGRAQLETLDFIDRCEDLVLYGPICLCSISCCGFSHDDFSGLGRACRPRNGLNWMVLVSPPERTGKDYDQHAPSTVYPSFAAERGIRRVDRAENTCQRADGA